VFQDGTETAVNVKAIGDLHLERINDNESTASNADRATDPPTVINSICNTAFGRSPLTIEWTLFTLNNGLLVRLSRLNSVWFRALFTLLPECFSAFPRGTCLLSVFRFVFSFRRNLSPDSGYTIKQPYSIGRSEHSVSLVTGLSPSKVPTNRPCLSGTIHKMTWVQNNHPTFLVRDQIQDELLPFLGVSPFIPVLSRTLRLEKQDLKSTTTKHHISIMLPLQIQFGLFRLGSLSLCTKAPGTISFRQVARIYQCILYLRPLTFCSVRTRIFHYSVTP
jgi:hypothetical protein